MRRKNSPARTAFLAAAILASAACANVTTTTAKIDIPSTPAIKLEGIEEIAVADFFVDPPVKDFAAGPALVAYFRETMKNEFKGRLSAVPSVWTDAGMAENKEAWTRLLAVPKNKLILTGRLQYAQDVRKALTAKDRRAIDDGPFAPEKAWSERKNFELKLEMFIIRAETGEIAFRKDFQEAIIVENKKQTNEYAFYDLLQRLRPKLFRLLFGSVRNQERYLLTR